MKGFGLIIVLISLCVILAGCGLVQNIKERSINLKNALLYKRLETLHLDFIPRSGLNRDENQTPLATMVWIYQLKNKKSIENITYQALLTQADDILHTNTLNASSIMIMPDGQRSFDEPLEKEANYIAILGLFRQPDLSNNTWRLILNRDDLQAEKPRVIELGEGWLRLVPD